MFILFVCLHSQIWKGSILILHICLCERGKKKKEKKKDALLPLSHVCVCVVRKRLCVKHYLQGKVKSCLPDSKWEQKEATIKVIIKRKNKNRKKQKQKTHPSLERYIIIIIIIIIQREMLQLCIRNQFQFPTCRLLKLAMMKYKMHSDSILSGNGWGGDNAAEGLQTTGVG